MPDIVILEVGRSMYHCHGNCSEFWNALGLGVHQRARFRLSKDFNISGVTAPNLGRKEGVTTLPLASKFDCTLTGESVFKVESLG